ncbi:MAG: hypothetical protein RL205_891 [Actinomycetota bacterium]|jgi:membrane protein
MSIKHSAESLVERGLETYPGEVVKRFYELQLTDKAMGLAAQGFIALLPMIIVVISVVLRQNGAVVGKFIIDRFSLGGAGEEAVTALFATSVTVAAVSWLAVVLTTLSALSLARRLASVYASIFDAPKLPGRQVWRALLWILLQVIMICAAAGLRDVWRHGGLALTMLAGLLLAVLWGAGDAFGVHLLVPSVGRGQLVAVGVLSAIGHIALSMWSIFYMPRALESQAEQFGAIGVTFALFTLILVAVVIMLVAPLMVSTWEIRKQRHSQHP